MQTMKKIISNLIILLILLYGIKSCHHYVFFGKKELLRAKLIDNNVFEEKFKSFSGGVLMSNTYTYYVTDSSNFRKYLGACDDKEFFRCHIKGDTIVVVKTSWRNSNYEKPIETTIFSIKNLKKEGNFE
jgi:hypothetical protein